jgi:ABC-type nickel/cobalt efflux system permease component RcnA
MMHVDMAKRVFTPVCVLIVIAVGCWLLWYNSSQQRLQRCVKAASDHYYATPEGQELHRRGSDPPVSLFTLECSQLGAK